MAAENCSGQQFTYGAGQQLLELLGLHIGGEADLVQIQDAVAHHIVLVAVQDLLHHIL